MILLGVDPSIVAVVFCPYWKKTNRLGLVLNPQASTTRVSGRPRDRENGDLHLRNSRNDHGLEFFGHLAVNETEDLETTITSTIGYNAEELSKVYDLRLCADFVLELLV